MAIPYYADHVAIPVPPVQFGIATLSLAMTRSVVRQITMPHGLALIVSFAAFYEKILPHLLRPRSYHLGF